MKFNVFKKKKITVLNYEGAKAYSLQPEMELYSSVVTFGLSNNFYENSDNKIVRILGLLKQTNPDFIAKLAIYTRNEMHLRSIPLVLIVELAKIHKGNNLVSKTIKNVVKRADEITELLSYYQLANNRNDQKKLHKLSKQIQIGLSYSLNQFDEYQFAKYNRNTEVKFRDAIFLVHPKPKNENQQLLFNKIINNQLEIPYTWETELSNLGQTKFENLKVKQILFKNKWEELIDSNKLGYMALLRNLRNIIESNVSYSHISKVSDQLTNEKAVLNSKQLPFRFLAAYREIKFLTSEYVSLILTALENAIKLSIINLKGFDENTNVLIACDVSGSMQTPISKRSKILNYDIGLMLGMLLQSKSKRVITGMFGDKWKIMNLPNQNILSNVDEFYKREGEVGYSTNGYLVIDDLINRNVSVDKIMIFTDCQLWNSKVFSSNIEKSWKKYKKIFPDSKLYLFDLSGYGNVPLKLESNEVYLIAGWSDKVFDVLDSIDNGKTVIEKINQIQL